MHDATHTATSTAQQSVPSKSRMPRHTRHHTYDDIPPPNSPFRLKITHAKTYTTGRTHLTHQTHQTIPNTHPQRHTIPNHNRKGPPPAYNQRQAFAPSTPCRPEAGASPSLRLSSSQPGDSATGAAVDHGLHLIGVEAVGGVQRTHRIIELVERDQSRDADFGRRNHQHVDARVA